MGYGSRFGPLSGFGRVMEPSCDLVPAGSCGHREHGDAGVLRAVACGCALAGEEPSCVVLMAGRPLLGDVMPGAVVALGYGSWLGHLSGLVVRRIVRSGVAGSCDHRGHRCRRVAGRSVRLLRPWGAVVRGSYDGVGRRWVMSCAVVGGTGLRLVAWWGVGDRPRDAVSCGLGGACRFLRSPGAEMPGGRAMGALRPGAATASRGAGLRWCGRGVGARTGGSGWG
jgi:hypothetical protein